MTKDSTQNSTDKREPLDRQRPVFIVGGSRTGSEMLKTMLSASPELDFTDELFLLCPRWLHKDLRTSIAEHVGSLSADGALDRLIDLLFSGIPYGWFWSVVERELDRETLRQELRAEPLSMKTIFAAIMTTHARKKGKIAIGAKFPTHYSFVPRLLEWFPECRMIHTTRNPKAVYASQASKYTTPEQGMLARGFGRMQQFAHINIQVSGTARLHDRLVGLPNYTLVKYEDVVCDPELTARTLCEFLGVKYLPQMLEPKQYGSSFGDIGGQRGVDRSSLERWRDTIYPITARSMDLMHHRAFRSLGYHNR